MKRLLALLALTLLLTGCSSVRLVDAQVQAIATSTAIDKGARYRFERLPSQADQPRSAQVEAIAQVALAQVGLVRNDSAARYSVLLGSRVQSYMADNWGNPLGTPGGSYGQIIIGTGNTGSMVGFGLGMGFPSPTWYRYEVSLLLRDLGSNHVVYETRAFHDGTWSDSDRILPALFEAALKDFPTPPAGVRRINIEIPR
jgi:hypothetical protein